MKSRIKIMRLAGCCVCIALLLCSSIMLDPSYALDTDPPFDARGAMGEDVVKMLDGASKEAYVSRNMQTGEITVSEPNPTAFKDITEIPPYIPEGLKIAEPLSPGSKAIIGDDNRFEISDVAAFPFSAMVYIEASYEDGTMGYGSGVFVTPTTILTSGTVIYNPSSGWALDTYVYPGNFESGSSKVTSASYIRTLNGWIGNVDDFYDFGLIELSSSLDTGAFGVKLQDDENLLDHVILNYGYPYEFDKNRGSLWYGVGSILSVTPAQFKHDADGVYGNSGGPIVLQMDPHNIVGIYASSSPDPSTNYAYRATKRLLNLILSYPGPA